MPFIDVTMIEGRTNEMKAELIAELSEAASRVTGAPMETIRVVIREVPGHHWGVAGKPKFPPKE